MKDIPISQAWALAYLISFLIIECLELAIQRQKCREAPDARTLDEACQDPQLFIGLAQLAFVAQLTCGMLQLWNTIPQDPECQTLGDEECFRAVDTPSIILTYWTAIIVSLASIPFTFLGILRQFDPDDDSILLQTIDKTSEWFFGSWLVYFFLSITSIGRTTTSSPFTATVIALIALSVWHICYDLIFWHKPIERLFKVDGTVPLWQASYWTIANVAALLFYYTLIFNPLSTYKPPWTEYLGWDKVARWYLDMVKMLLNALRADPLSIPCQATFTRVPAGTQCAQQNKFQGIQSPMLVYLYCKRIVQLSCLYLAKLLIGRSVGKYFHRSRKPTQLALLSWINSPAVRWCWHLDIMFLLW